MRAYKLCLSVIFFLYLPVFANSDELITFEIGGASNSPGIVDKNRFVIEEKFFDYETDFQGSKSYDYILGDTKLRYGLIQEKLEARIYSRGLTLNDAQVGFTNTSLGAKYRVFNESKYFPVTDLILDFEIPLGDPDLRNSGFDHSYMFVLGKKWSWKWASIANLSLDFASYRDDSDEVNTAISLPYAFNINYSPKDKWNIFSHIYGTIYFTDSFENPLSADLGTSYALNKDLVLVGWLSKGLNNAAPAMSIDFAVVYSFGF
jgi:hypothetical protein